LRLICRTPHTKTCAENGILNGYEELDPDIQNAITENFQTGAPTVMAFAKVETLKLPVELGHGRNGAGKRSLLTRKKIDVPRRKSLGLRIKGRTSVRKLGESQIQQPKSSKPLKAANEELESYAETELQEFSQHTAIQEPEVETKRPMKVENSTSGKALEAIDQHSQACARYSQNV
jgi:hypothetical protein